MILNEISMRVFTSGYLRKEEYLFPQPKGREILNLIPKSKLQNNEGKLSQLSDDGNVISAYFGIKCLEQEPPVFDDIEYLYDNVEMVSLKYIKETDEHYYKYYVRFNPLNVQMDNIVATGFVTNDPTKATIYIAPDFHEVEEDNERFFLKNHKGITIDIATGETLMETDYEPTSPEGSQG